MAWSVDSLDFLTKWISEVCDSEEGDASLPGGGYTVGRCRYMRGEDVDEQLEAAIWRQVVTRDGQKTKSASAEAVVGGGSSSTGAEVDGRHG